MDGRKDGQRKLEFTISLCQKFLRNAGDEMKRGRAVAQISPLWWAPIKQEVEKNDEGLG